MERPRDVEPPPEEAVATVDERMGIRLAEARAESWLAADDRSKLHAVWVVVGGVSSPGDPDTTLVAVMK